MTHDVIKTCDLQAAGVPRYKIDLYCRPGGPWQRILPGVVLLGAGPPTRADRVRAALAYAGPEAVLTGVDALRGHGVPDLPLPPHVHVLQPAARRRSGDCHVLMERTTRLPRAVVKDGLPLAPPARAVLDAARHEPHPARRHALLVAVVRAGACTVPALLAELDAGSKRGTAAPRAILRRLSQPTSAQPTSTQPTSVQPSSAPPARACPACAPPTGARRPTAQPTSASPACAYPA